MTTFTPNNPIVPLRMGIRHDPPTLALVYKRRPQDAKERIYSILLNGLVELSDPKIIALKLFEEHALILNENIIDMDQVENLVGQLQRKYEERKALSAFNNPQTKDLISPIHTYESQNKNPYNIQDNNDTDMFLDNTTSNQILATNHQINNNNNNNNLNQTNDFNQGDSYVHDLSYQQSHLMTPVVTNQQNMNNNDKHYQGVDYNYQQKNEDIDNYMTGYNPTFPTKIGSATELKRLKVKNKNEKNKQNLGGSHKNLDELIQAGVGETSTQQYMNSHYNYGQRKSKGIHSNNAFNENSINYEENEFIDQDIGEQNPEYNEDYHNVMDEEQYAYQNNGQNIYSNNNKDNNNNNNSKNNNNNSKNKHIQIPPAIQSNQQSQQDVYGFQNTPMKGYIDTQMDYQDNLNGYSDHYGAHHNQFQDYPNNHNNAQYFQSNQNIAKQGSNAPFFSKRQSSSTGNSGYPGAQEQELLQQQKQQQQQQYVPSQSQENKKRRSKLNQLKELANMHRENEENIHEDQLEVI